MPVCVQVCANVDGPALGPRWPLRRRPAIGHVQPVVSVSYCLDAVRREGDGPAGLVEFVGMLDGTQHGQLARDNLAANEAGCVQVGEGRRELMRTLRPSW